MKTLILLLFLSVMAINCGSQEAGSPKQAPKQAVSADDSLFTAAARNLTGQFGGELMSTLQAAMDENGPAYALGVCQVKAQKMAATNSGAGWTVKRVSEKWRNIADRPDSTDRAILAKFADPASPAESQTRWSGPDSARVFSYYQKITVKEMCLQCHGDIEASDPDLWKQIKIEYPYDKAMGYKVGDLRGMFVVSAHLPTATASAKRLADGVSIRDIVGADTTAAKTK